MRQKGKDYKKEIKGAVKRHNNVIRSEIRQLKNKCNKHNYELQRTALGIQIEEV